MSSLALQASELQTLMNLGLDGTQAKTYFKLARFGPSSVAEIAKELRTSHSDAYCIILQLQELGLVEKTQKSQITKFKTVSADQTLKFLMQLKSRPQQETAAQSLFDGGVKNCGVILVPYKAQIVKNIVNAIINAKESIDLVFSWDFFSDFVYDVFPEKINSAVTKRCVIEQPRRSKSLDLINKIKDFYTLRYIQTRPKALFAIVDKKEAVVIEDPIDLRDCPALWITNQNMLTMVKTYFDNLWRQSTLAPVLKRPV
jgi:sugar-specific transcriptional regulator TrmB